MYSYDYDFLRRRKMQLESYECQRCGGGLSEIEGGNFRCGYCGAVYHRKSAEENTRRVEQLFDEVKREQIRNLRRNLYDAVNEEYLSSEKVRECAAELKKYLPSDFAACFYEVAVGNNVKQLTKYIRKINVEDNYSEIEYVVRFLIKSLQTEYLLELNNLVERAYKQRDLSLFEKYSTDISVEAEKVEGGVYETKLPREVFIAYSSKDMEVVSELCEVLEAQGLKCFVAARNLRHGKGSVENYDRLLCEAMDHCKSFVFVSSANSRNFSCDALTKELPYIQQRDIENAPAEHKNNYANMPHSYKKPRVEYRIEESRGFNAADAISNEFFDGYERVYSPEAVAERVASQLISVVRNSGDKMREHIPTNYFVTSGDVRVKYCVGCFFECSIDVMYCSQCGCNNFADTRSEAELKKKIELLEKEKKQLSQEHDNNRKKSIWNFWGNYTQSQSDDMAYGLNFSISDDGKSYTVCGMRALRNIEKIDIPSEYNGIPVKKIGNRAFYKFTKLRAISIPMGIDTIGEEAFGGCSNLTAVTMPGSIVRICDEAFYNCCNLTSLVIPDSVTSMGSSVFYNCSSLTSIKIPNGVRNIGDGAFYNCYSLTNIEIPDSVTSIGTGAFKYCSRLVSIVIGNSVTSIGNWAFEDCKRLMIMEISDSVKSIGEHAFYYCSSLNSIMYKGSEDEWKAIHKGYYWDYWTGDYKITYNYKG